MTAPMRALSRRGFLGLLGAGAASAVLGGCSAGSGGTGTSFTWQAIPSYSLQGTDPKRVAYLQEQRAAYESSSPWRIVPQVTDSDTSAAMSKLLLQSSQGRAPDVSQVDGYLFGRVAPYAQVITAQLSEAKLALEDWFPEFRQVMTAGGPDVKALQFTSDVRVLYHRKDVVPKAPASWDELIALATPLSQRGLFVTFPAGRSEGSVTTTLWPLYLAQGAELFDDNGDLAFATGPGYDAMRAALTTVQQAVAQGISPARVATFGAEDNQNADVVAGRVAMFIGGNWQAASLNNLLPSKDFFTSWGVAPLPSIGGERHVTSTGGWTWAGFTEDPHRLTAALDWVIDTYVSDRGMAKWCSLGGYLPPRRSVYDDPAYTKNPFTDFFRDQLATIARARPSARKYLETSHSLQVALSAVASGSAEPERALDAALNRIA
jgi:multiple sugar transport system substrate-binding protein